MTPSTTDWCPTVTRQLFIFTVRLFSRQTGGIVGHCSVSTVQSWWAQRPQTGKLCPSWPGRTTNSIWVIRFQSNKRNGKQSGSKHVDIFPPALMYFCSVIKMELANVAQPRWEIPLPESCYEQTRNSNTCTRHWILSFRSSSITEVYFLIQFWPIYTKQQHVASIYNKLICASWSTLSHCKQTLLTTVCSLTNICTRGSLANTLWEYLPKRSICTQNLAEARSQTQLGARDRCFSLLAGPHVFWLATFRPIRWGWTGSRLLLVILGEKKKLQSNMTFWLSYLKKPLTLISTQLINVIAKKWKKHFVA